MDATTLETHEPVLFLRGQRAFRNRKTLKDLFWLLLLSVAAWIVGVERLVRASTRDGLSLLGLLACLIGLVLLCIAVALVWAFSTGAVTELEVSERGVRYGKESWPWESIKAIRLRSVPPGSPLQVFIWVRLDQGVGRILPVDGGTEPEQARRFIELLLMYFRKRGLDIRCEY